MVGDSEVHRSNRFRSGSRHSSRYSACEIHQAGCQGEELGRRSGEGYEADGDCQETKFKDGAERKEWVLAMLKASADGINYDIDYDAIADMIDSLCDMSKVINPATPANKVTAKKEEGK